MIKKKRAKTIEDKILALAARVPKRAWIKVNKRIFSGDYSRKMWDEINGAMTVEQLRDALYTVCCRLQELEAIVRGRI